MVVCFNQEVWRFILNDMKIEEKEDLDMSPDILTCVIYCIKMAQKKEN